MDEKLIERLKGINYVVEANSFEVQALWEDYASDSPHPRYQKLKWEQDLRGFYIQLGSIGDRPIWMGLNFATIEGKNYLFIEQTSQLCDWKLSDEWVKEFCPNLDSFKTNAMNFPIPR